jgi:hypothetical protein
LVVGVCVIAIRFFLIIFQYISHGKKPHTLGLGLGCHNTTTLSLGTKRHTEECMFRKGFYDSLGYRSTVTVVEVVVKRTSSTKTVEIQFDGFNMSPAS